MTAWQQDKLYTPVMYISCLPESVRHSRIFEHLLICSDSVIMVAWCVLRLYEKHVNIQNIFHVVSQLISPVELTCWQYHEYIYFKF